MLFYWRTLSMALHALGRNYMRSALTTLGIVIGVGAVITMTEIGQGTSLAVAATIKSMGASNLLIFPGSAASSGANLGSGSVMTLTPRDVELLVSDCFAVEAAAPIVRTRTQVVYNNRNWSPNEISGTTPAYFVVREWETMYEGEPFTKADVANAARVCVLGRTIARELFPNESPVGKDIRVNNVPLRVVGVLTKKGASMTGQDQDDILLAPWTTIKRSISNTSANPANTNPQPQSSSTPTDPALKPPPYRIVFPNSQGVPFPVPSAQQLLDTPQPVRFTNIDRIIVRVQEGEIKTAIEQIKDVLRESHHIKRDQPEDFTIRDMSELSKALAESSTRMMRGLIVVALVSLVVGGVGIMNIMLVSVTERTRDRTPHGGRGALRDILLQFLVESIVLCLLGGLCGIVLGKLFAILVSKITASPIAHSTLAMVAAVGVSAFVGIVFGFYPAWKASRLDPIDALRYE